jgi:glycosyltransferase involved in cell wall biosynthesis
MSRVVLDARMLNSSGIGRYTRDCIRALREAGVQLTQLSFNIPPYNPLEQIALPLMVPPCDLFFSPHITTTLFPVRARRRILTIHDVFHLTDLAGFGSLEKAYARFLYSNALRTADSVIAVSEFTRSEIARLFPTHAHKVSVVYNSVDQAMFYPDCTTPIRLRKPYVLFVGNMKPHKNLAVAVRAIELQPDPDLRLVVVGQKSGFLHGMGPKLEELQRHPRLVFLETQDDGMLRRLYSHAECLVAPSGYEGFGYPPLEAMACGAPVICSSIAPFKETCRGAAAFCDPDEPESFAGSIECIRSDSAVRSRLVKSGLERVREFSFNRFREGTLHAIGAC